MEHLIVGNPECPFLTVRDMLTDMDGYLVITSRWIDITRRLELKPETTEKLKRELSLGIISFAEVLYQILVEWRGIKGNMANISSLVVALDDAGGKSVADKLRSKFKPASDVKNEQGTPLNLKNTIPSKISYYISRKLISRNIISNQVLKPQWNKDVFLVSGMERSQLTKLVNSRTDIARNQMNRKNISVKFLILEMDSDFEDVCKITKDSVHWLQYNKNGTFAWVKSRGDMRKIQECINKQQKTISETDFLESLKSNNSVSKYTTAVLISDSPGMGKSVIIANIGLQLKELYPGRIVSLIVMGEFYSNLKNEREPSTANKFLETLSCQLYEQEIDRQMFIDGIKTANLYMELLVDGFDEVGVQHQKEAVEICKQISNTFQNVRLWVTTRPHLLDHLENRLETIGYNIQPFEYQDQINCLVSFWSIDKELDNSRLELLAATCLKTVQSKMKDRENSIAGVPLQCMLIGEVFQEDAVKYANPINNLHCNTFSPDICIKSITDLYVHMIEKKILEYIHKYPKTDLLHKQILHTHLYLSLFLLFPDSAKNLKKFLNANVGTEEVLKIGIMESNGRDVNPRFIHRTFAEYFVALFTVDCLKKEWDDDLTQFFLENLLATKQKEVFVSNRRVGVSYIFEHNVICFFFDSLLANYDVTAVAATVKEQLEKQSSFDKANKICHACVSGDFSNIFKLLNNINFFGAFQKQLFNNELVWVSTSYSGEELLSIICEYFTKHQSTPVTEIRLNGRSVLHEAVSRGDYSIVEYLLQDQGFDKVVENGELETLLHCCVSLTISESENIINDKKGIIRLLCGLNKQLLEERNAAGSTPILCSDLHTQIFEELINLGSNVLIADNDGDTLLHMLPFSVRKSAEDYHKILSMIPIKSLKKLVAMTDKDGNNPLHKFIHELDPNEKILKLFQQAGTDFNSVNFQGDSVLVTGITHGRSLACVKLLTLFGAKLEFKSELIICAAAANGDMPLLEYLIKDKGFDAALRDSCENTPLHYAAKCGNVAAVRFLIEKCKADLNACNNKGQTPLLHALEDEYYNLIGIDMLEYFEAKRGLDTPELLTLALRVAVTNCVSEEDQVCDEFADRMVEKGANIRYADNQHNTLLHLAAGNNCARGVRYLVKKGLNVNVRNKQFETPLLYSLAFRRLLKMETVKALVELGADLNAIDKQQCTPLHNAIKRQNNEEILEYLVSTGAYTALVETPETVYYSALHSKNDRVFQFVCKTYSDVTNKRVVDIGAQQRCKSVLHAALKNINTWNADIVRYLVNEEEFGQLICDNENFQDLIHACVEDTTGLSEYIVANKIDAIECLLDTNQDLLFKTDDKGRLCFHVQNVHQDLQVFLSSELSAHFS